MSFLPKRILSLVAFGSVGACSDPPDTPVSLACVSVMTGTTGGEPAAWIKRCRCADRLAKRQLGDDAYLSLTSMAREANARNFRGIAARLDVAVMPDGEPAAPVEAGIIAADLTLVAIKASVQCRAGQG